MSVPPKEYTVLLVEDDKHTLELLSFMFLEAGFKVVTACDVEEAWACLQQHSVDLIISDVMMPGADGFEFRDRVLRDVNLREAAFMFVTAKTLAQDQIRGLRSGVDEYITKPFDPEVLVARAEAVLLRRETYVRMASIDPLTQVLNRPTVERAVSRDLDRLNRYPAVSSFVFLDVDNFKPFNDCFGHAVGDDVLIRLAAVLRRNIRKVDVAGRYGGEEFIVYFPETKECEVIPVAERMLRQFRESTPKHLADHPLSFSAGVAEAPRDGKVFETLFERADYAMYVAKRLGKGRIVAWRPELEAEMGPPTA